MSKPLELSKAHLPESGGGGGGGGLERNCICCSGTKAGVSKSPGSLQLPRQPHPPRRGRSPSHSLIGLQLPFCQRQTPAGAACKWTAVVAPVEEEEEEEEEQDASCAFPTVLVVSKTSDVARPVSSPACAERDSTVASPACAERDGYVNQAFCDDDDSIEVSVDPGGQGSTNETPRSQPPSDPPGPASDPPHDDDTHPDYEPPPAVVPGSPHVENAPAQPPKRRQNGKGVLRRLRHAATGRGLSSSFSYRKEGAWLLACLGVCVRGFLQLRLKSLHGQFSFGILFQYSGFESSTLFLSYATSVVHCGSMRMILKPRNKHLMDNWQVGLIMNKHEYTKEL